MSTSRIPNIVFLGLLFSLCMLSGLGIAEQIVHTEADVVLEVGSRGVLPCRIQRRTFSIEWKRQVANESESLVSLHPFSVSKRHGPGYESGMFNITDDYSLVIKDVKVQDEGLYMCSFSDYQMGITFRNSTRVSVQASPDEPFPTIQECIGNFVKPGVCTLTIHSTSNLTCSVLGYYPYIDLLFLHGSEKMTFTAYEAWTNVDGTKSKITTVQISVSDEPYKCVASGLPGNGGNRSVSVIVQVSPQDRSQGPNTIAIVVPVTVVVVICLIIVVSYVFHLGKSKGLRSKRGFEQVDNGKPIEAVGNERLVSRHGWGGREPKSPPELINAPVSYVILLHTAGLSSETFDECCRQMRLIQDFHMDERGWDDIGYSFVVGNDGRVYEGRGWNTVGAHTIGYNRNSIGVAVAGSFNLELPSKEALEGVKYIIDLAVTEKVLTKDYVLLGQRQASPGRPGPGDALYKEIQSWPHWKEGNFFLVS